MGKDGLCHVCGDRASGKHYGVPSCDGCRGFFKRSIRRNLEYTCKEGGNCLIDVTRRNQCQACRFAKCLRVNMKRDAVQHERAPRSNFPPSSEDFTLPSKAVAWDFRLVPKNGILYSNFMPHQFPYFVSHNLTGGIGREFPSTLQMSFSNENEVSSFEEAQAHNCISERHIMYSPFSVNHILSKDITECATKLLIYTIRWTNSIPSFLQLSDNDKRSLLSETWNELFILNAVQRSCSINENILSCNSNFHQTKKSQEFQQKLRELTIRFQGLQVDNTEFTCLKAITLFKPETSNLQDQFHIEILQDQTQIMLLDYSNSKQSLRFGKLLLLLKLVASFQTAMINELFFEKFSKRGYSIIQDFIMEILDR